MTTRTMTPAEADPYIELTEWQRPIDERLDVQKAIGGLIVEWPSGKRTLEFYAGDVVMSDIEATAGFDMRSHKTEQLVRTMANFRQRVIRHGYFIRDKHRKKARRIVAHEWIRISAVASPRDFFDWRAPQ